jgi:hypothetical protein
MLQPYKNLKDLINLHLPQDSTLTSVNLAERFGSTCVDVHYTISAEYQQAHGLTYKHRILSIRLIQAPGDKGFPINSFADAQLID